MYSVALSLSLTVFLINLYGEEIIIFLLSLYACISSVSFFSIIVVSVVFLISFFLFPFLLFWIVQWEEISRASRSGTFIHW